MKALLATLTLAVLTACGGGGGSDSPISTPTQVVTEAPACLMVEGLTPDPYVGQVVSLFTCEHNTAANFYWELYDANGNLGGMGGSSSSIRFASITLYPKTVIRACTTTCDEVTIYAH